MMGSSALAISQRFIGVSKNTYRLLRPASPWHEHVWVAQSEMSVTQHIDAFTKLDADTRTVMDDSLFSNRLYDLKLMSKLSLRGI